MTVTTSGPSRCPHSRCASRQLDRDRHNLDCVERALDALGPVLLAGDRDGYETLAVCVGDLRTIRERLQARVTPGAGPAT